MWWEDGQMPVQLQPGLSEQVLSGAGYPTLVFFKEHSALLQTFATIVLA